MLNFKFMLKFLCFLPSRLQGLYFLLKEVPLRYKIVLLLLKKLDLADHVGYACSRLMH